MNNIKSPIASWDYKSLYAIASDSKANKTIAHNTIVSLKNNWIHGIGDFIVVSLHGNDIATISSSGYVALSQGAYDWITYTTCNRLQKIMIDNRQDGISRKNGKWERYRIEYD